MQTELFSTELLSTELPSEIKMPACVSYWPNVLSKLAANNIYQFLIEHIQWGQPEITVFGKSHAIPRMQCWMANSDVQYNYSDHELRPEPCLPKVMELKTLIEATTGLQFNSVLLNWYRDGNDKMGWHSDNEIELGANPAVATLSLGAERDFHFRHNNSGQTHSIFLENGSLLLMKPGMQSSYKHQLPARKRVSQGRISLTFRYVHNDCQ